MGLRHKHNPCHFSGLTSMTQRVALTDECHREVLLSLVAWPFLRLLQTGRRHWCSPGGQMGPQVLARWVSGTVGRAHFPLPNPSFSAWQISSDSVWRGTDFYHTVRQSERRLHVPRSRTVRLNSLCLCQEKGIESSSRS